MSFVERHVLWSAAQKEAMKAVREAVAAEKLETIRLSFADQHGVLRGKTLMAEEALKAFADGCMVTTTMILKDTSHRTVYPVFTAGGGLGMREMQGAADIVMVADPTTFKMLPWADKSGWVLCDLYFPGGRPVPFSSRQIMRAALDKLAARGQELVAGLEVEFHLFRLEDPRLAPADATQPGQAPEVSLISRGYQYLTEQRYDQMQPALDPIRRAVQKLGLPLRSGLCAGRRAAGRVGGKRALRCRAQRKLACDQHRPAGARRGLHNGRMGGRLRLEPVQDGVRICAGGGSRHNSGLGVGHLRGAAPDCHAVARDLSRLAESRDRAAPDILPRGRRR